jgi:hypothetical protein
MIEDEIGGVLTAIIKGTLYGDIIFITLCPLEETRGAGLVDSSAYHTA